MFFWKKSWGLQVKKIGNNFCSAFYILYKYGGFFVIVFHFQPRLSNVIVFSYCFIYYFSLALKRCGIYLTQSVSCGLTDFRSFVGLMRAAGEV